MEGAGKCAIVLAGGKSSRMGRDKALLEYEGRTFLQITMEKMLQVSSHLIVVADTAGKYSLDQAEVIEDLYPDTGPVGGILTGLLAAGSGSHYVVACDMPFLSVRVLSYLMDASEAGDDAVIPEVNGGLEPLCAVYRHTAAPKLRDFLEGGGRSAQRALAGLSILRIGEAALQSLDPGLVGLTNVNTPADLKRLR